MRRWAFWSVSLILTPVALFAIGISYFAVTGRGLALGLGILASSIGLLLLLRPSNRPGRGRRRRLPALAIAAGGVTAMLGVRFAGPGGVGGDERLRIEHFWTRAEARTDFLTPGPWLPEADLVSLGIGLAPFVDPIIDRQEAKSIRALVMPKYEAIAADPAFRGMGSALGSCFRELVTLSVDGGHVIAVCPRTPAQGATPPRTLIFLHGSGGNFAVYWKALSPLALEHGIHLMFPTFGIGNWNRAGGVDAIISARRAACDRFALDPGRVFLAVLSNGGRGATRLLARGRGEFRGLALISAVLEEDPIAAAAAAGSLRGLPVLFAHGHADDRVAFGRAEEAVRSMESAGALVTRHTYAGEDHFLLFSRLEDILRDLVSWMQSADPVTPPR